MEMLTFNILSLEKTINQLSIKEDPQLKELGFFVCIVFLKFLFIFIKNNKL